MAELTRVLTERDGGPRTPPGSPPPSPIPLSASEARHVDPQGSASSSSSSSSPSSSGTGGSASTSERRDRRSASPPALLFSVSPGASRHLIKGLDCFPDLRDRGWEVVPGVLGPRTCGDIIGKLWDSLTALGVGIVRDDVSTHGDDRWPQSLHGIIQGARLGQSPAAWAVRSDPEVHRTFARLWGEDNLRVSMDAVCIVRPPENNRFIGKRPPRKNAHNERWYHLDQGSGSRGERCVQGFVTLEDITEEDSTLCVLEHSHRYHSAFFDSKYKQRHSTSKEDWVKLSKDEIAWYKGRTGASTSEVHGGSVGSWRVRERLVTAKAGDLVLWDSRTVHCNRNPVCGRANPRWRYVVYVCMMPAMLVGPGAVEKRRQAVMELRTTSHRVDKPKLFGHYGRTYGKDLPMWHFRERLPELPELGRKLLGLPDYEQLRKNVAPQPPRPSGTTGGPPTRSASLSFESELARVTGSFPRRSSVSSSLSSVPSPSRVLRSGRSPPVPPAGSRKGGNGSSTDPVPICDGDDDEYDPEEEGDDEDDLEEDDDDEEDEGDEEEDPASGSEEVSEGEGSDYWDEACHRPSPE